MHIRIVSYFIWRLTPHDVAVEAFIAADVKLLPQPVAGFFYGFFGLEGNGCNVFDGKVQT